MIFHSVVGKLWITLVVFVAVIFLFLSIFLIEYFDNYYYDEQSENLAKLGSKITNILENQEKDESVITAIEEIVEILDANMVVTSINGKDNYEAIEDLFTNEELNVILENQNHVIRLNDQNYKDYIAFNSSQDKLVLGIPIQINGNVEKVIILYQTLGNLYETTNDIKKIILLFAFIGIVITTIFTFFLSTRITAPITELKDAVLKMATGNFKTKVKIKTNDEIGELALSFNQMAERLEHSVQALSNEKEKLASILESMADGVITFNKYGEVVTTNPPAQKIMFSMPSKGPIIPPKIYEMLDTVISESKNMEDDIKVNGRTFAVKMAPLYWDKTVNGSVTVFRDVTYDRKLDKLRKDFLANVSHELRTPLSMLQGYSEAMIDDMAQSPEEIKELAQIIHDESLRMRRLVNDLLDLAKMESGNYQMQFCKGEISHLLQRMVKKFTSIGLELDIKLKTDIDSLLPEIFYDEDRMEQVFTNLIDNAIRHTPKGGDIVLRAKKVNKETVLLEVQDSGVGIPEEDLPFVFERFYKADKARTRGQSGTGLGLSIVKNIVQAHGGIISVMSAIGQGTTFSIKLPTNNISKINT